MAIPFIGKEKSEVIAGWEIGNRQLKTGIKNTVRVMYIMLIWHVLI